MTGPVTPSMPDSARRLSAARLQDLLLLLIALGSFAGGLIVGMQIGASLVAPTRMEAP